jgi:Uma2 family endonuclease
MTTEVSPAAGERGVRADEVGLPLVLRLAPVVELSDDQLLALCEINHELWIERNARGELLLMPPAGGETGNREIEVAFQLQGWAKRDGTGVAFSASTGFLLPNGAMRAADGAWAPRARWEALTPEARKGFLPFCPDFVVELRSPSDRLRNLQDKLAEWIANGARLGWLIDREPRHVYVYRPDAPVERLDAPDTLSASPVLPGFALDLREVW